MVIETAGLWPFWYLLGNGNPGVTPGPPAHRRRAHHAPTAITLISATVTPQRRAPATSFTTLYVGDRGDNIAMQLR